MPSGQADMHHLVAGQVVEFLTWSELTAQSAGGLHIYLPLWDRGIDALVHRRSDGAYIPVQVKGHTLVRQDGWIHLVVPAESMADDDALIVCALLQGDHLADWLMVVDEGTFKRQATVSKDVHGRDVYDAAIRLDARSESHWDRYMVGRSELAARFGAGQQTLTVAYEGRRPPANRRLGSVGEAEVIRRLAGLESLSIFRPFPDIETAEIVARHVETFGVAGLQVKTVSVPNVHTETTVDIQKPSFTPAPSTWFTVLTWLRDARAFHDDYLLIPSGDIEAISHVEAGTMQISFTPGSTRHARVEPYRRKLANLGEDVASLIAR